MLNHFVLPVTCNTQYCLTCIPPHRTWPARAPHSAAAEGSIARVTQQGVAYRPSTVYREEVDRLQFGSLICGLSEILRSYWMIRYAAYPTYTCRV